MTTPSWSRLCEPMPHPKPWRFAVGSSSGLPRPSHHHRRRWPPPWPVSGIPSAVGVRALCGTASRACRRRRARVARGALPPAERVEGLSMATKKPATSPCPAPRWRLDALGAARLAQRRQPMRRASRWRLLAEADRKPHRSVYGRTRHAPDGEAHALCQLSVQALRCSPQGRVVICADAKTGRPMVPRASPPQPVQPGKPAKREHEDIRHGVRAFLASFVVPTGPRVWHLGQTRPRAAGAAPLANVVQPRPAMQRDDGGGRSSQDPREPRGLPARRPMVSPPVPPQGLAPRRAATSVPERSDPSAWLPRHAPAWVMAPSRRVVVERLGPSCAQPRRLCCGPRLCHPSGGL
jgi:hypothetical protein